MKSLYTLSLFSPLFFFLSVLPASSQDSDSLSSALFSLNACAANFGNMEHFDFSEFTAQIDNSGDCADLEITSGHLYLDNSGENMHSCTPGVNGTPAMCIASHHDCTFTPGTDQALKIDVRVTPGSDGVGMLSGIMFYERAPEQYVWLNGGSGPNNYPTRFAVRVLQNGEEIFLHLGIPTERDWNLNIFDFSDIPAFTVTEPTVFNIELLGYCPVHNGADVSAWDIDEITVLADCCALADGGDLEGGPFEFCVGDGEPDHVSGVTLSGDVGAKSQYIVTDEDGNILALPPAPDSVNFDGAGGGICLIWHISYYGSLGGLAIGNNLHTDLEGACYGLSDSIVVVRNEQPEGGALVGGPFEFCVGDGMPDFVSGVILGGATGANSQYVVTDAEDIIIALPTAPDAIDFDNLGPGTSFIWHLSHEGSISGLEVGNNLMSDLEGCFDISNPVQVVSNLLPEAGELSGGPFAFCVGDGMPDNVSEVTLTGGTGDHSTFVITDDQNNILRLADTPEEVDFDGGGPGTCLIWHVSYSGDLDGLDAGNNLLEDLVGCFAISNFIEVVRNQPEGGELSGGPFTFCVGDTMPDMVSGVNLSGNVGDSSQYVVTDTANVILSLQESPDSINFDGAGAGICLIWHISFFGDITGLEQGNNLSDLGGCLNISNAVEVIRTEQPEAGELSGGPFEFCIDSIPNFVDGVDLSGNTGDSSQYLITDTTGVILQLSDSPDSVDFNAGDPGICLIWHLSYNGSIGGVEVGNNALTDLMGCYSLSNAVMVTKLEQPCEDSLGTNGPQFDFLVMPNPVYDKIELELRHAGFQKLTVRIFDSFGRECLASACNPLINRSIDVSKLSEGHYFIRVEGPMGAKTKGIVLLR